MCHHFSFHLAHACSKQPLRTIYDILSPTNILPPTKTLGDLVVFGENGFLCGELCGTLLILNYTDFNCQTWWKIYQDKNRMQLVGNYLGVL